VRIDGRENQETLPCATEADASLLTTHLRESGCHLLYVDCVFVSCVDVEKVARLSAYDVLICYSVQSMADAIAAFHTVFGRRLFCIINSIVTGSITHRRYHFM